ncbi:MAG: hypothetical protein COW73_04420 [Nitrospirae bacterium CG18_big_fil_WC_8_21_14_2_50_70_55]|nr:hypothetical protein [Deltaproteobacteria bacterium]NCP96565.1 hypothetical protein [Deltaproteobacteria bacterium]PIQ05831.1 MAG: hypothetical protein COW73_04420 [Nitrospirae bacterium CG18_big_fil_WC_8_21_14_2_50_70_55]PIU79628.1 MAG: hypothetical protein COS73_03635 [Nitrospirae bacterium CG06_land_8_20_14_3_00_70_43]
MSFTPDFDLLTISAFQPDGLMTACAEFTPTVARPRTGAITPRPTIPEVDLDAEQRRAFEQGFAQGERAGLEVGREKATSYLATLADAVEAACAVRAEIRHQAHEEVTLLAVAIAERTIRRTLALDRPLFVARLQTLLAELDDPTTVTLRLHPLDLAYIEQHESEWRPRLARIAHLNLEESQEVQQGDICVETPTVSVDARIATLLTAIGDRLTEAVAETIAEATP